MATIFANSMASLSGLKPITVSAWTPALKLCATQKSALVWSAEAAGSLCLQAELLADRSAMVEGPEGERPESGGGAKNICLGVAQRFQRCDEVPAQGGFSR